MRERINRLAKGIIDMEVPKLLIQPERIEEEVQAGEIVRKEVFVTSENGLHSKGLVYSTNSRVQVQNSSFGGLRNHISYEINTKYLECDDMVEGSFYLVTNGGEKEIPYSFRVQAGTSGRTLGQLRESRDFARMAREDYEMALRIFEYRDFVDVPFMQDMHIRAVYDGLKGHGNRYGQLEQFLIALGVKKPVKLEISELQRQYHGLDQTVDGEIVIKRSGWGYTPIQVNVNGSFIQVVKQALDERDFQDDVCKFPYRIDPAELHGGKNFGSIELETAYETLVVKIEASAVQSKMMAQDLIPEEDVDADNPAVKITLEDADRRGSRYLRYLLLRLDYEGGRYSAEVLHKQMLEELEHLRKVYGPSMELVLMEAELKLLMGREDEVSELLESCKAAVVNCRMEHPEYYCLYQYLMLQLNPDREKKVSFNRLLRKYVEEGKSGYLIFYLYTKCEEQHCYENPGEMLTRMKVMYSEGCHSPFLYQQALAVWNDAPQLLYGAGSFEMQVLYFGARRQLVTKVLAVKAAKLACLRIQAGTSGLHSVGDMDETAGVHRDHAAMMKSQQALWLRILKLLYEQYPDKEILEAICSLMIRGECREERDFPWYERAVKEQLSLTRLYEYFLYSLPADYKQLIPKEVLLYFSYDNELDRMSRAVLYANIIRYMKPDSTIYREYQKEMGRFAAEQVLQSRIDNHLAVIYDAMIYEGMVDVPVARVLPSLLKSYRISVKNPRMRQVVVRYEELLEEGVYPIYNGIAYVPVFSSRCCILFQDAYGNRYTDVSHIKTPVLEKPQLEKKCFEVYPKHPMLLMGACRGIVDKAVLCEEDLKVLEQALEQLRLHPLYRGILTARMIEYYQKPESAEAGDMEAAFLSVVEEVVLSYAQKKAYCEALIAHGYYKEAYELLDEYRCEIEPEKLACLCARMILNQLFDQDELLLGLAFRVFEGQLADSVILDYLCEHFNGTSDQMYRVLEKAVAEHVESYDLEERLLAQMLFSGETKEIDKVFSLYIKRKKAGGLLVKAYFTVKSAEYFLYEIPADESVFRYLESMVYGTLDKEKVSTIYLLALTKYYAGLGQLDEEQKALCQAMVDVLLEDGMIFAHYKDLEGKVRIPEDILDKGIIQYVGHKDSRVDLQIRICPQEEKFHSDEMKRVYQGIFIRQKVLFEGESLEYRIYEQMGDERILMDEGIVICDRKKEGSGKGRFQLLNEMSMCLKLKEEPRLKQAMEEYVKKTEVIEGLFDLL